MLDTELLHRVTEEVRELLGLGGGEPIGRRVRLGAELLRELLEDGERARTIVHERAVEVEDDHGRGLSRDPFAARNDARHQGLLLAREDA